MAQQMKYIIFETVVVDGMMKHDVPFVFPEHLVHFAVASSFGRTGVVESAGFCQLVDIELNPRSEEKNIPFSVAEKDVELGVRWICWGKSDTLKAEANPEIDQRLLDQWYR